MRDIDPSLFVLGVVGATTLLLHGIGRRKGLGRAGAKAALGRVLEWAGLTALFFAVNLAVGFLAVLALRRLSGGFVSLYLAADATLLVLSAIQAVAFQWWMAEPEE